MAAQGTGHTRTDHLRVMGLAEAAVEFACDILEPGGAFLCKVFQGGTEHELLAKLKRAFTTVRHVKPPASRTDSAELYVLATGFRGRVALRAGCGRQLKPLEVLLDDRPLSAGDLLGLQIPAPPLIENASEGHDGQARHCRSRA